ncbi:Mfa1 family fimbria major subunit [Bacteroides sp. UBA939]|uniref:Mfa1 family fimbria major subunit n=1 Tax=Bacteroides sp. UBA939 TaxID=1946092 RepID=UPI0025C5FA66|nr:Mfa1 family fimbria major subunit [Bacteroides sp. UBA939]
MKRFKLTYCLLVVLMSVVCLPGCVQDEPGETPEEKPSQEVNVQLTLLLSMPSAAGTRAPGDPLHSGTDEENACNKLTLFIVDTNNGAKIQHFTQTGTFVNDQTIPFTIKTSLGGKKVFVAANMDDDYIDAVKAALDHNPAITIADIVDVASPNDFLMTGQAVLAGTTEEDIEIEASTTNYNVEVKLTRVMAKVLLTCTTKTYNNTEYLFGFAPNDGASSIGYIRLEHVHYILETTNKKFFPFEKGTNTDANVDPNFLMSTTLPGDFFGATIDAKDGKAAVKYDESKLFNNSNRYTDGIYCLENTIDIDEDYSSNPDKPKQVGTYLKIAAKFTPKYLFGNRDGVNPDQYHQGLTESVSIGMYMNNVTLSHDFVMPDGTVWPQGTLLPNETFFTCKKAPDGKYMNVNAKDMCYPNIDAGIKYLSTYYGLTVTPADFTIHLGSLQYYETFVNSPTVFDASSGVVRNNYYILNITKITPQLTEKTIEVNTVVLDWEDKGTTTIDIETIGNHTTN